MRWFPTIIGLAVGIGMWTFLTSGLFILTDHGASGLREVAVYDVRSRAALRGFAGLIDMEFFQRNVDTFAPVWTVDSRRVRFKTRAAGTTKLIETSVAASSGPSPIATRFVVAVFIPKGERTALYLRFANGSARRILTVAQLPKTSRSGLGMDAQGFSGAALAPDRDRVAFATLGQVHGWVGLLSLRTGAVREFDFFYGGHATDLAWSPNGRFIALTDDGPSGIREVAAYLVESGKPVSTFGALIDRRFFQKEIETYAPVWSDDSRSLRFKAKGPGSASRIETWEALLDGTRLRRVAP